MPVIEEVDSGIDAMSASNSREDSPTLNKVERQLDIHSSNGINEEDNDIDETLEERLWALTEMFPFSLRNFTSAVARGSISGIKSLYSFSRSAMWIFFSSSTILMAPVIFEVERMQMDEVQRQQQRQILLGPSAAVSGGGHNLPIPMPPHMASQR